jgi:thiamine pyrophosphate-dependent acetolactate synthase large subunit-like protein
MTRHPERSRGPTRPSTKRLRTGSVSRVTSLSGHAGAHAVAVAQRYGVTTMFTLSGGHVFPLYDGAVKASPPLRLVDVRHEQTAAFAAEGVARLTRVPGLAVVTAGPGITNTISAVTSAWFNGAPVVILGGRAPDYLWGKGALQEMDHVPLLKPITKHAWTVHETSRVAFSVDEAFRLALTPHRGPVFCDFPLEAIYGEASVPLPELPSGDSANAVAGDLDRIAALLMAARRPVLVLGSDVWLGGAEAAARGCAEALRLPVLANGQARGILPHGHDLLLTRARAQAFAEADLVIVAGVPLDFRLRYGSFGPKDAPADVVHVADSVAGIATHCPLGASAAGDLATFFTAVTEACGARPQGDSEWLPRLQDTARASAEADATLLASPADPVHPMRVYGELLKTLDDDAVVIGDGGDFVSFAGRLVEPAFPGRWLDPGPYGCLGTGLGYAMAARLAHPASQVVLLLGDGAAGLSLMDVDTLVRHDLPVVIIVGNNSAWGLEKEPMRAVYGYDVAADLGPRTRYDEVVRALGGAGELVTTPDQLAPALKRAFAASTPYLVNVITDVSAAYPRTTTGV